MGQVAEMLAGQRQHLGLAEGRSIDGLDRHKALDKPGVTGLQMAQQHAAHVALTVAVAQQQYGAGGLDGSSDFLEIGVIERRPLTGDVAVMAVAEALAGAPQTMGWSTAWSMASPSRRQRRAS